MFREEDITDFSFSCRRMRICGGSHAPRVTLENGDAPADQRGAAAPLEEVLAELKDSARSAGPTPERHRGARRGDKGGAANICDRGSRANEGRQMNAPIYSPRSVRCCA